MRLSQFCVLSAVGILCLPSSVFAAPATLQPKTAAAVIAADEDWLKAEETGDTAYVDNLLLPEYRSVNADGSVHDKAAILASAHKNVGSTARTLADEKWLAAHPMGTAVLIQGDTAIVTFYLKPLGPQKGIMSSDIFVYRDGQWHAIYSQHTDAGK
jgi:hypothetical protein